MKTEQPKHDEIIGEGLIQEDSEGATVFIDKVHQFETGEIYVWVGLKEGYDWHALDTIKTYADSVVYQGDETKRTRFPLDEAQKYLNLDLLNGIIIFNYQHENLGKSRLKRVEFFEDVLGEQFVAVLEPAQKLQGELFYGINGINQFVDSFNSEILNSPTIKDSIKNHIKRASLYDWSLQSVLVEPYQNIYTFYSFIADGDIEKSFLVETNSVYGNRIMSEITNDYSIRNIIPVPVQINKKPILLLWVGPTETDIEWYTPAVFNGIKYEIINTRIFELQDYLRFSTNENDSIQCKGEILLQVQNHMENLDSSRIHQFLRTFDVECDNNAEYTEWSNELLFEILNKYPKFLISVLDERDINSAVIVRELESPVNDKYRPEDLVSKVDSLPVSTIRDAVLCALIIAENNY